jgi:hypothetical protein
MYKFIGKITEKGEVKIYGKKDYRKLQFVVVDDTTEYHNYAMFELTNNNIQLINNLSVGDKIEIIFNIKGRYFNEKLYTSLEAYKIYPINY